ncbi:PREDICTED: perlucin-like protein isoform X3 [Branchiostoma belcheri]|uniref:Perlucin-like protein isoform X3 n=1 Tax=Branchiostoma belcheri TaxID=7741 RepID=A0A6P4ZRL3_BRABE|nr:PREDICTED: perlucin-like protein isoform X3 [Branchiostoma belcheri]
MSCFWKLQQLEDIQAMLIAQQVQISRLQNDSDSSEISRLSRLLAEQRNITENLKKRVAQLEESISNTSSNMSDGHITTNTEPVSCPADYQKFNRTCYRFSTDKKPYSEARDTCHGEGGILATVKDEDTHNFLANHVSSTTHRNTWIGLSDLATEGLWVWDDGTLLLGQGIWGTGEPNGGRGENCAHIFPSKNYRWNDGPCSRSYNYICEIRG